MGKAWEEQACERNSEFCFRDIYFEKPTGQASGKGEQAIRYTRQKFREKVRDGVPNLPVISIQTTFKTRELVEIS